MGIVFSAYIQILVCMEFCGSSNPQQPGKNLI